MSAVGSKVLYHSNHGDWVGFITDHEAGRDGGDFHVKGFTNAAGGAAGDGDTFSVWTQPGDKQGQFTEL